MIMILGVDLGLSVALHFSDNRMATFVTDLRVIIFMILKMILRIWSWYSQGGYDLISYDYDYFRNCTQNGDDIV